MARRSIACTTTAPNRCGRFWLISSRPMISPQSARRRMTSHATNVAAVSGLQRRSDSSSTRSTRGPDRTARVRPKSVGRQGAVARAARQGPSVPALAAQSRRAWRCLAGRVARIPQSPTCISPVRRELRHDEPGGRSRGRIGLTSVRLPSSSDANPSGTPPKRNACLRAGAALWASAAVSAARHDQIGSAYEMG